MGSGARVTLDGRYGEGGGQLLRTALSLSCMTGRPIRLENVRGGRERPGLRPQHLTAVDAAAAICDAAVQGDGPGSRTLRFTPEHPPRSGRYRFDVAERAPDGSAGSTSLVLQTVIVPLARAEGTSRVHVHGGTHVAWSPPFHYLKGVYGACLDRFGYDVDLTLHRWGFYPAGEGHVEATIRGLGPDWKPEPRSVTDRGELERLTGFSAVGNLPPDVLQRQRKRAEDRLLDAGYEPGIDELTPFSRGPGSALYLQAHYAGTPAGFTGYGRRGKRAESVADDAVDALLAHHAASRPVDPHLADQLVLPLVGVPSPVRYETSRVTEHLRTAVHVVDRFLNGTVVAQGTRGEPGHVQFNPDPPLT